MSREPVDLPEGLPGFNWGAFFLAPIWGVAHGQWSGVFFLPLWVFVDNVLSGPRPFGVWTLVIGWSMALVTLGFQVGFARNANRYAWLRAGGRTSLERFVRGQRAWAIAGGILFVAMALWVGLFPAGAGAGI